MLMLSDTTSRRVAHLPAPGVGLPIQPVGNVLLVDVSAEDDIVIGISQVIEGVYGFDIIFVLSHTLRPAGLSCNKNKKQRSTKHRDDNIDNLSNQKNPSRRRLR